MTNKVDIALIEDEDGIPDIDIDENGDLVGVDGLETSIEMQLSSEQRLDEDESATSIGRGGWLGNENASVPGFEIGSKLRTLEQAKSTQATLNNAIDKVREPLLRAFVPDDAKDVVSTGNLTSDGIVLSPKIVLYSDNVDNITYELWKNTGE